MAAFLFSFAAAFYKKATVSSSPYWTLFVTQFLAAGIVLVFQFFRGWGREVHAKVWRNRRLVFFLGLATFFEGLCLMIAFGMAGGLTSYAIGVKRTSILFTIVMGFIFFGEGDKVLSLAAGAIMLVGIFLIAAA
jgi:drug/metabolite transporter (DMT)-like permease